MSDSALSASPASLVVIDPHGHRTRVLIEPLPFHIGRQPGSDLILRDSRVSRSHSRIFLEDGQYYIEDNGSRHGTFVNGARIQRHRLATSDRIEFGTPDSYQLIFAPDGSELKKLMEQMSPSDKAPVAGAGGNLAKLRAILDLARTLQSSFSTEDVLSSVVDTALAITGAERGFLMLRGSGHLETKVARHRGGHRLHENDLRVPRDVIHRALQHRRELLSMNFDPVSADEARPQNSIADLELRSVICVPLVRIRTAQNDATSLVSTGGETVGVLYMDSRAAAADLAGGNRELLQTLAIEASTVLENARLLEEERAKQQLEEELRLASKIQQSLLPRELPSAGWLCACGSAVASREIGGDYFDMTPAGSDAWSIVVADVSGKGPGSALLASLLQGALITAADDPGSLGGRMERLNSFLLARTAGEKYATVFYGLLGRGGEIKYVNAAHCPPVVVGAGGEIEELEITGPPVGLLETADFSVGAYQLCPGDKLVMYTDGVTEAQNPAAEFFGLKRLRTILRETAAENCTAVHDAIHDAVAAFTEGAPQSDDITVLVLEFRSAD
jgi:serine phosphatase RsbU (regulator of sigma subunit)